MSTDVQRLEEIYDAHAGAVHLYARRFVDVDAEDVVAEVFLTAWRRIAVLPPEPLPWLLATTRRVAANARRSQRRRLALEDRSRANFAVTAPIPDPAGADSDRVRQAVQRLSVRDQETLILAAWLDLAPSEAAGVMACTTSAYRVRLHRARSRLRNEVQQLDAKASALRTVNERERP